MINCKRPQRGGWKPTSPRKPLSEKMVPLVIMVKQKHYTKAAQYFKIEAQKFRT